MHHSENVPTFTDTNMDKASLYITWYFIEIVI